MTNMIWRKRRKKRQPDGLKCNVPNRVIMADDKLIRDSMLTWDVRLGAVEYVKNNLWQYIPA